jgi:hypothetical protein
MTEDPFAISRLAIGEASEQDIKYTLQDPKAQVIEWETIGVTFVLSVRWRVILRTGAMGGDTFEVQGGWKYALPSHALKEWKEIKALIPSFQRKEPE